MSHLLLSRDSSADEIQLLVVRASDDTIAGDTRTWEVQAILRIHNPILDAAFRQAGDPAFGMSRQRRIVIGRQVQSHYAVQEPNGFVECEAQIGSTQLDKLATRAQLRDGQERIDARGDDQVQAVFEAEKATASA